MTEILLDNGAQATAYMPWFGPKSLGMGKRLRNVKYRFEPPVQLQENSKPVATVPELAALAILGATADESALADKAKEIQGLLTDPQPLPPTPGEVTDRLNRVFAEALPDRAQQVSLVGYDY